MLASRLAKAFAIVLGLALLALGLGFRSDRDPQELEMIYAAPPSSFVTVSGLRMHYRDRGSGPAILLLHGSNSSLFTWEGWAQSLASSHRVVTMDLPGHGLTGPDPQERYSAAAMSDVIDQFATAVGLVRFSIGGNSMGGNVAWHYALAHPDRVERLILVDSGGLPRREPRPIAPRLLASPLVGPILRWVTPRFIVERSVRDVYGDPTRIAKSDIDRYDAFLLRAGNREATRERLAGHEDSLYTRLGEIHAPTLILWGSADRWILPKYADEFHARIPSSRVVVFPGLGHVPMEEDPQRSVEVVKEFLDRG
jgi:pimeloyl-ACP methyl ester carboxylesterase